MINEKELPPRDMIMDGTYRKPEKEWCECEVPSIVHATAIPRCKKCGRKIPQAKEIEKVEVPSKIWKGISYCYFYGEKLNELIEAVNELRKEKR